MKEAVFAIYILMHVVFTPANDSDHESIQYKATVIDVTRNPQECVATLNEKYRSGNYDPKTNSFGCIRVVHPQHEQLNNQMPPSQRHDEGSHGKKEAGVI